MYSCNYHTMLFSCCAVSLICKHAHRTLYTARPPTSTAGFQLYDKRTDEPQPNVFEIPGV